MRTLDTELADIALRAASFVAPYLRKVARTSPATSTKKDIHDPVTIHDRRAEDLLRQYLGAAVPGSKILGEEKGDDILVFDPEDNVPEGLSDEVRALGARLRWIVDPIDGTANFAAGLQYFGTSVAAELDGEVVAGAITIPCAREAFVADKTRAWHVSPDGTETDMHANGPSKESEALLATYYPGLATFLDDPEVALEHEVALRTAHASTRSPGAGALDLAHVAAGWIGVSMGLGFSPWDVAAGIHMVRVAGGNVLNLPMGTDLPDGLRPGVVASGANLDATTARQIATAVNSSLSEAN